MYKRPTKYINGKQQLISRISMEKYLGRKLSSFELVHHKNHDPFDNRIENLELVSRSNHKKIHKEIGESTRFKKKYEFNVNSIMELFKNKSCLQIAREIGCSDITIRRLLKKLIFNIDLKTHGYETRKPYPKNRRKIK